MNFMILLGYIALVVSAVAAAFVVGYAIVAPILAFMAVVKNAAIDKKTKSIWGIAIFLLGPIAAGLYYYRHSESRRTKFLNVIALALTAAILVLGIFAKRLIPEEYFPASTDLVQPDM